MPAGDTPPAFDLPAVDLKSLDDVTADLANTAAEYDRTGAFPSEQIARLHAAGLLTAGIGPEYGGPGLGFADLTRVLVALGTGDPAVGLIATMTIVPHVLQRYRSWPEALYRRIVAESAAGPTLINHARAEPAMGSSTSGRLPATTARRSADGWVLNGRKSYVTGAEGLRYLLVWAATDENPVRVGAFVVPGDAPGVEIIPSWHQLGMRATGSHEVVFTDVPVPRDDVLDLAAFGATPADTTLPPSAILVVSSALYLGVARAAQRVIHQDGLQRLDPVLGRRAAGEIEILLSTADQLIQGVARRLDDGDVVDPNSALAAKVVVVRHVTEAVTIALRQLGNRALAQAGPLERHFRDIQSAGVHAPVEAAVVQAIGTAMLR